MAVDRTRVLVPIGEPIGGHMSAVGIRQFEVGRALAVHCDVTFASTAETNDEAHGVRVVRCRTRGDFRGLLRQHDVVYTLGLNPDRYLDVVRSGIRVVFDIYTPIAFEILEAWPDVPTPLLSRMHRRAVRWTEAQLERADFIVCANERQRDLWLGVLNSIGRLTAERTRIRPDCRDLIDVCSFGISDIPPTGGGHPLRDCLPGVGEDDFLLVWSSKILSWQDPCTLLLAMRILLDEDPRVRLVFLGIGEIPTEDRRDPFSPSAARTREAVTLARSLGVMDRNVFFITDRVPYRDIGSYYRDADAAVSTYPDSLETRFCLGSRILDYVWADLPMVVSGCELQREFIEQQGLGFVVPPADPLALAEAIKRIKANSPSERCRAAFAAARERLNWRVVVRPILSYCISEHARVRQTRRRTLCARVQLAEFLGRSAAIRVARRWHGVAH